MIFKLTFRHLISRPILSLFTLAAVVGCLTILGTFWTVIENLERVKVEQSSPRTGEGVPGMTIFLDPKLSDAEVENIKKQLLASKRFESIDTVSAAEALKNLEQQFGQTLSKAFANESLPITLKIQLANSSMANEEFITMLNEVRAITGVLDVDDGSSVLPSTHEAFSHKIFSWATGLLILVFSIVALLVSHLIRIAFESLRQEVETFKILGASKFWIFKPLFLEGIFFGITGAIGAMVVLTLMVNYLLPKFSAILLPKGLEIVFLSPKSALVLCSLSVLASIIGALFTWPLIQKPASEI